MVRNALPAEALPARPHAVLPLLGAGIAAGLLAVFLAIAWIFGSFETVRSGELALWEYRELRMAILVAALAGYLPVARRYVIEGARRNFSDLAPLVAPTASGAAAVERRFHASDPRAARAAGAAGTLMAPLSGLVVDRDPGLYFQADYWGPEVGFAWVVGAFAGFSLGLFVYQTLFYARRFSRLAGELDRIDLLDLHALDPFARQGLRSALLWLLLVSLLSLNAADLVWFAATAATALVGGTAALVLPVRGVHLRLRGEKREELARVRGAIRGDPGALAGSPIAARSEAPALGDLLAYRAVVESVREWPFDAPALLRFALYLAIPLGSWLGGALVERILASLLG